MEHIINFEISKEVYIMKSWRKPEAVGQEFAANEYVSACVRITCDFDEAKIPPYGYGLAIPVEGFESGVYFPCNHEFDVAEDELVKFAFTATTLGPGENAEIGNYPAYYWLDVKEDGSADFHACKVSTVENAADSNKS